jgi:hypothetical protein
LDALRQTLDEMGYPWVESRMEHGAGIKLSQYLQLVPDSAGNYNVIGDYYYVHREIPNFVQATFMTQLQQRYSYIKVRKELSSRGYSVISENTEKSGEIKLSVRRLG